MSTPENVDYDEIAKFEKLASRWWDPNSEFKPLHDINPLRAGWIDERADVQGKTLLDVGCGGGILAESLAAAGAQTTGIDMATKALGVAKLHALDSEIQVNYVETTAEEYAALKPAHFRTVTCLEMLEHVTHYPDTIKACADLAQPGGDLFFSTINRNPKAYLLLVLGAEYLLNILPKGTHEYAKFIKPSELAQGLRDAGLELVEIRGMNYNPLSRNCRISNDTDANYIVHARKPQ